MGCLTYQINTYNIGRTTSLIIFPIPLEFSNQNATVSTNSFDNNNIFVQHVLPTYNIFRFSHKSFNILHCFLCCAKSHNHIEWFSLFSRTVRVSYFLFLFCFCFCLLSWLNRLCFVVVGRRCRRFPHHQILIKLNYQSNYIISKCNEIKKHKANPKNLNQRKWKRKKIKKICWMGFDDDLM